MIVRFIAVARGDTDDIEMVLSELLSETLSANQDDFELEDVAGMVRVTHQRACAEKILEDGTALPTRLVGFTVSLPNEVQFPDRVLDEFTEALPATDPFDHACRFEDGGLKDNLAQIASELFELEMKLRRALTYIYLHAYPHGDPYDLLREETQKPLAKDPPKPEAMKAAGENPLFHLTFSQYVSLNQRLALKTNDLILLISSSDSFDNLRAEIVRQPVEQEDDAVFIAGLKAKMDAVERMRNCVAHNRRPSDRVRQNYDTARPELESLLDNYLARIECG
jgi:hypothetical protein